MAKRCYFGAGRVGGGKAAAGGAAWAQAPAPSPAASSADMPPAAATTATTTAQPAAGAVSSQNIFDVKPTVQDANETDNGFKYESVQFGLNGAAMFARLAHKF